MQNNEHNSIVADMLSDWKGYGPDILKQPGENTVAEYAHARLSHVYLPSTCDITHVITYTRPSSLLFYFWVRGREEGPRTRLPKVHACAIETHSLLGPAATRALQASSCQCCIVYSSSEFFKLLDCGHALVMSSNFCFSAVLSASPSL